MLRGHLIGGGLLLVDGEGLPVVETEPPEAPEGYAARPSWVEGDGAITQVWSLVPEGGTVADAVERLARMQAEGLPDAEAAEVPQSWVEGDGAITQVWSLVPEGGTVADAVERLARMQAEGLPDAEAAEVPQLFDQWSGDGAAYAAGDRVCYAGALYRCLTAHTSQWGWDPADAPSLWAAVLPGQDGEVGEWAQPDSTNPYGKGDRVTHGGKVWESTADNNVWEPGATGAPWREVG